MLLRVKRGHREVPGLRQKDRPSTEQVGLCFHYAFEFRTLNGSRTCQTPWSVFQDGSEGPPTKKRQICGPHQRGCSLYETAQIPVPAEARNRRLPRASSRKLHSSPRSGKNGSSREETVDCSSESAQQRQGVLADRPNPSRQTLCLNHRRQLREPLRLLLHSFTYF